MASASRVEHARRLLERVLVGLGLAVAILVVGMAMTAAMCFVLLGKDWRFDRRVVRSGAPLADVTSRK